MNKEDYFKYYIQGSDHYLIPKDVFKELFSEMMNWKEEAKGLKKQLEEYKATNKILSHELTKDKVLQQDCLTTCCGIPIGEIPKLITQQKEFISYLENEKDRLARECSQIYEDSLGKTRLVNEDKFDEVNDILQKYKEVIGKALKFIDNYMYENYCYVGSEDKLKDILKEVE